MIHVKGIDWQPESAMHANRKDGRFMLLWANDVDGPEIGSWEGGVWVDRRGYSIRGVDWWADINPPA